MPSRLAPVKTKALILSALLLAPLADASAVQPAPAPAMVKITEANLPAALSDEELDDVKGEFLFLLPAAPAAAGAISAGGVAAGAAAVAAGAAVGNWLGNAYDAAKSSRQSGKEAATDIPSWSKGVTGTGDTPKARAEDIMDQRYGEGNWGGGNQSKEFNQIKKNQQRQDNKK